MTIKQQTFIAPAIQGDVGGVALHASIALGAVLRCLEAISAGHPVPADELTKIREAAENLDERFNRLAGWTPDP